MSIISLQLSRNCVDYPFLCLNVWRFVFQITSHPSLSPPQRPLCVVGRLGRKKKEARGARSFPARFLFFWLLLFLLRYPAGTSVEERASKLVTRGQLFGRVTHNSQQLYIPLFKTAAGQRSFQYRVVSLWNSPDRDLKWSKNRRDFKQKLTQILLHKFLDPSLTSVS